MNRILLYSGLLLFLVGCGEAGKPVVPVTGTVTRNGKPVPRVAITFTPENGRPSWGQADENGHFKMLYTQDREGAEVGKHQVVIEFPPAGPQEESDIASGRKRISGDRAAIMKKYGNREHPALVVEVTDEEKPIELKLD